MRYVIVGGGIAACSAVKAINNYDREAQVTVISEEEHCFYYRPMTPLVIKGDKERDDILYTEELPEHRVIGGRAETLDADGKQVKLNGGATVPFERLLIATGSSPVVPPIPGIHGKNVFYLRSLQDAHDLKKAAGKGMEAVILGGGLVGIKKAVALNRAGLKVTVIEQLDHILLPRLDRDGAEIMAEKLAGEGIRIITSTTIGEIINNGKGVKLANGEQLGCDLVCVAVGVKPNIEWLSDSGLNIDRGIVVDEKMETSSPCIFAAGDVVETTDLITGSPVVSALWGNAVDMGKVAGANMAGGGLKYPGSLEVLNATEIERVAMISAGDILARAEDSEVVSYRRGNDYRKLVFQNDVLTGVVFVGNVDRAGIYTSLIKTGVHLGALKEKAIEHTLTYVDYIAAGH